MKVIIAGSRNFSEYQLVAQAVQASTFVISEVVSGTARGVDRLGQNFAFVHNIPVRRFPANWDKLGKSAGFLRNIQMAEYADALIAIWDGHSSGTKHMIAEAKKRGLKVYIHMVAQ